MIYKIVCMLIAAYLCIDCVRNDNYKVCLYWLMVVAYWASNIWGGR